MTTPQTIRNIAELEVLEPDAIIVEQGGNVTAEAAMKIGPGWFVPAAVVATMDQVRATRKALEET